MTAPIPARFELAMQLAAILHDDWAFLGVILDADEGEELARALGACRALILKNHGLNMLEQRAQRACPDRIPASLVADSRLT